MRIHTVLMPNGKNLASRDAWMMNHPGFNAGYDAGDLVELEDGVWWLNEDLVPWRLATEAEIEQTE